MSVESLKKQVLKEKLNFKRRLNLLGFKTYEDYLKSYH